MIHFRLLNIPVHIQPAFWLFLAIFCFQPEGGALQMGILALVFASSLLFHELGHALAAQKFGKRPEITLESFGGYASYDRRGLSEGNLFVITLSGPLFTGLLIGISYYLLEKGAFTGYSMQYFLFCTMKLNTYWLIVNLAPLYPLDGGKISEFLLGKCFGKRARMIHLMLGNAAAVVGTLYFIFNGSYLFAYLFLFHGWQNLQVFINESKKSRPSPFSLYNQGLKSLEKEEFGAAEKIFRKLIGSDDQYIKILSLEGLANGLHRQGKLSEAYQALLKVEPEQLKAGKWLLCKLAYAHGHYPLVGKLSRAAYEIHPTFETALTNAKAFAQMEQAALSVGWLKTASQFQSDCLELALSHTDFDPIRNDPAFEVLSGSFLQTT